MAVYQNMESLVSVSVYDWYSNVIGIKIRFLDTREFPKSQISYVKCYLFGEYHTVTLIDDTTPEDEEYFRGYYGYFEPNQIYYYCRVVIYRMIDEVEYWDSYPWNGEYIVVETGPALVPYLSLIELPDAIHNVWRIPADHPEFDPLDPWMRREYSNRYQIDVDYDDGTRSRALQYQPFKSNFDYENKIGYLKEFYSYPITDLYDIEHTYSFRSMLYYGRTSDIIGAENLVYHSKEMYKLNTPNYTVDINGGVTVDLGSPDYLIPGVGRSVDYILMEYEAINEISNDFIYDRTYRNFFMHSMFNDETSYSTVLSPNNDIWEIEELGEIGKDGYLIKWLKEFVTIRMQFHPSVPLEIQGQANQFLYDWIIQVENQTGITFNIVSSNEDILIEIGTRLELNLDDSRGRLREVTPYPDTHSPTGFNFSYCYGEDAKTIILNYPTGEIYGANVKVTSDTPNRPESFKRLFMKYLTMSLGLRYENYHIYDSLLSFYPSNVDELTEYESIALELLYDNRLQIGMVRSKVAKILNARNIYRSSSDISNFTLPDLTNGEVYRTRIWVTGRSQEQGFDYCIYSFKSNWESFKYGLDRPLPWFWTDLNGSGEQFNLSAEEWNNFTTRINEFRAFKDLEPVSFDTAITGEKLTAIMFLQASNAINEMTDSVALECRNVEMDGIVYRWYLDNLAAATNYI